MPAGDRLDTRVQQQGLADSLPAAQALIRAGQILVNDQVLDKPGTRIPPSARLRRRDAPLRYVSRAGLKLEGALDHFQLDPGGLTCADLGASTGGFTDCLLQRGAAHVFAIDVGYGQLAWKLQQDPRVTVLDRTNARLLDALPVPPALIVGDVSFISLRLLLPAILRIAAPGAQALLLIKPQFELDASQTDQGRVRDPLLRARAIQDIADAAHQAGSQVLGTVPSSLPGAKKGNIEELILLQLPG